MTYRLAVPFLLVFALGCSSGDSSSSFGSVQQVQQWSCCSDDPCACEEQTQHYASSCSNSVDSCGQPDGGVGCCVASHVDDGKYGGHWLCQCSLPGAACPEPDPSNTSVESVASCPP